MALMVAVQPCYAGKNQVKVDSSNACFALKNVGAPNNFYYCGQQGTACAGVTYNKRRSGTHWYYHAGAATVKDDFENRQRMFVCCNGSSSSSGKWVEVTDIQAAHPTWGSFRKEENYTRQKQLPNGGYCNQQVYNDVCGGVSVATDCDKADSCSSEYILRNESCVKPCAAGKGFKSDTSNECVDCKTTLRQGVNLDGVCVTCGPTQFFNAGRQQCFEFSEMVSVSMSAHNDCWLCGSEGAMFECFKQVTQYGSLENIAGLNAEKLKGACSLEGTNSADFHLPPDAVAIVDEEETSTSSDNASRATQ